MTVFEPLGEFFMLAPVGIGIISAIIYAVPTVILLRNVKLRSRALRFAYCLSVVPMFVALMALDIFAVFTFAPEWAVVPKGWQPSKLELLGVFAVYCTLPALCCCALFFLIRLFDRPQS